MVAGTKTFSTNLNLKRREVSFNSSSKRFAVTWGWLVTALKPDG